MKKIISTTISFAFTIPIFAYAEVTLNNPIAAKDINDLLVSLLDVLVVVSIPILVLAFIWAGFKFVLAQGSPDKIKEAKNNLFYSVLGAILIIGIKVILEIVKGTIGQIKV